MKLIFAFYLFTVLLAGTANARTPAEDKVFNAPMPHETINGKGASAKVHRVQLNGYLEGNPDNQTGLSSLKQEVQKCVDHHRKSGAPIKPVEAWPEFLLSLRQDIYSSVNRSIEYSSGMMYGLVDYSDCSLLEYPNSRAELVSSKGRCSMDLILKTARGVCDANAHADAMAPPPLPSEAERSASFQKAAADPRTAAMAASIQHALASIGGPTGERKTILGLECDVGYQTGTGGGTLCFARGGSFVSARTAGNPGELGILLEIESKYGYKMKAVNAKLDTEVNSSVFAPYLNGGFTIENRARK